MNSMLNQAKDGLGGIVLLLSALAPVPGSGATIYNAERAGVTISVNGVSTTGATVNVSFGPQSCARADPSVNLSPSTGDWVAPGDVIATVGDSGGQNQSSLYFELRRGTQPLNPSQWVTRRPGQ